MESNNIVWERDYITGDIYPVRSKCACEGTGLIPVPDRGGEGIDYQECAAHHPAYRGQN